MRSRLRLSCVPSEKPRPALYMRSSSSHFCPGGLLSGRRGGQCQWLSSVHVAGFPVAWCPFPFCVEGACGLWVNLLRLEASLDFLEHGVGSVGPRAPSAPQAHGPAGRRERRAAARLGPASAGVLGPVTEQGLPIEVSEAEGGDGVPQVDATPVQAQEQNLDQSSHRAGQRSCSLIL